MRGGVNISPDEIDNELAAHPKVAAVCVVGVDDEILGERIGAAIVPKPGETVTLEDLTDFLKEKGNGCLQVAGEIAMRRRITVQRDRQDPAPRCQSSVRQGIVLTETAFIYDAVRTPRGKGRDGGALNALTPLELQKALISAILDRNSLDGNAVSDVILGCVTQVGEQGGNIAKVAALVGGLPSSVSGITINRYCTSGLDACNFAAMKVMAGVDDVVFAGGVESMSRVPMLSDKASFYDRPRRFERSAIRHYGPCGGSRCEPRRYQSRRMRCLCCPVAAARRSSTTKWCFFEVVDPGK